MRYARYTAFMILGLVLLAGAVAAEYSVWQECRTDHSFFYCWRMLSK